MWKDSTVSVLSDSPLSAKIVRFSSPSLLNWHIGASREYTIEVECFAWRSAVVKTCKDFRKLHKELSAKIGSRALPTLPEDRMFGNFDDAFLEKQRQQLDSYLKLLTANCLVLLDGSFWHWLSGRSGPLQHLLSLAVAHSLGWTPAAKADLLEALDAEVDAAHGREELHCCLHPAVLELFRQALQESNVSNAGRCALGCLLEFSRAQDSNFSAVQLIVTNLAGTLSLELNMDVGDSLLSVQGKVLAEQKAGRSLDVELAYGDTVLGSDGTLRSAGILPGTDVKITAVFSERPEPDREEASEAIFKRSYGH